MAQQPPSGPSLNVVTQNLIQSAIHRNKRRRTPTHGELEQQRALRSSAIHLARTRGTPTHGELEQRRALRSLPSRANSLSEVVMRVVR